jgi:hypothetical protein
VANWHYCCPTWWKRQVLSTFSPEIWIRNPLGTHLVPFISAAVHMVTQQWDSSKMPWRLASLMALHSEVSVILTAKLMVLFCWITYILCSGNMTLLHLILPQVMVGERWLCFPQCLYCGASVTGSKCCCVCWRHGCILSSIHQQFNFQTFASWCKLLCMQVMPDISSDDVNHCLHIVTI